MTRTHEKLNALELAFVWHSSGTPKLLNSRGLFGKKLIPRVEEVGGAVIER